MFIVDKTLDQISFLR